MDKISCGIIIEALVLHNLKYPTAKGISKCPHCYLAVFFILLFTVFNNLLNTQKQGYTYASGSYISFFLRLACNPETLH